MLCSRRDLTVVLIMAMLTMAVLTMAVMIMLDTLRHMTYHTAGGLLVMSYHTAGGSSLGCCAEFKDWLLLLLQATAKLKATPRVATAKAATVLERKSLQSASVLC